MIFRDFLSCLYGKDLIKIQLQDNTLANNSVFLVQCVAERHYDAIACHDIS